MGSPPAALPRPPRSGDVAWIVAAQFAVLYLMENGEALGSTGTLAGGWSWLGTPLVASLAVHVVVGMITAVVAARVVRVIASAVFSIVQATMALVIAITRRGDARFLARCYAAALRRPQWLFARRIGGRAPPSHAAA